MRRRGNFIFNTAEELEDSMVAYLEEVDALNRPRFVVYDQETGQEYESVEKAEEADVTTIVREFEPVPVYALKKPTIGGFCAFVGASYSMYKGLRAREEMKDSVEWFETILEDEVEQLLLNPSNRNASGAMKVAINRYDWRDKTEVEQTGDTGVTVVFDIPNEN